MSDENFRQRSMAKWRSLSDGDRSVLAASLQRPKSLMMTTRGSGNFEFWSMLGEQGLMVNHGTPDGMPEMTATFSVADDRQSEIAELLGIPLAQ